MTTKFGRNYQLAIQAQDDSIVLVQPPLTMEFDIVRNVLSSANTASIRVLNLGKTNRNAIRKNINTWTDLKTVTLKAGYQNTMPLIFSGMINRAWSQRETGSVDFVSQIESLDAGFAFANNNPVPIPIIPSGTSRVDSIKTVIQNLPGFQTGNIQIGAIGNVQGNLSRANSHASHPLDVLRQIAPGFNVFVDLNKVYVLADNEYIYSSTIPVINSSSGLLGTPLWEGYIIHFDMIFEPSIKIGQALNLQSSTDTNYNGLYKVISLHHRGIISPAVSGTATTTVGLFAPSLQTELIAVGGPN